MFKNINNKIMYNETDDTSGIYFEKCGNGQITARIEKDGRRYYVHSKYEPIKQAEKFVLDTEYDGDSFIIVFGLGLGYHIRELLKNIYKNNFIIIFEPCEKLFNKALKCGMLNDILENERVFVFALNDIDEFKSVLSSSCENENAYRIKTAVMSGYDKIFNDEYKGFLCAVRDTLRINEVNCATISNNSYLWSENIIKNISYISESYDLCKFKNLFKDKPVIMVSAGPSLDKNVDVLKKIKDKAFIICVFVAAKVLLRHGIKPDLLIITDSRQKGFDDELSDVPIAFIPVASQQLLFLHQGKKIALVNKMERFTQSLFKKYSKQIEYVSTGGSVACTAIDFAYFTGANPIVMIGQDLAFTDDKFHAEGTEHKSKNIEDTGRKKVLIPSFDGKTVYTEPAMYTYILWFEEYIREHKDVKIINATEGGALIKGALYDTLENVYEKYIKNLPKSINDTLKSVFIDENKVFTENEILRIKKRAADIQKIIPDIKNDYAEAVTLCERLIKIIKYNSDRKQADKIIKRLNNIDESTKKLEEFKYFTDVMSNAFQIKLAILRDEKYDEETYNIKRRMEKYLGINYSLEQLEKFIKWYL